MTRLDRTWQVPAEHPAFAGHFPGYPIVPGVVLLDRVLQLAQAQLGNTVGGWRVKQVKFLKPCGPLDELRFELQFDVREDSVGTWLFSVRTSDHEVASGSLDALSP